jgi:hypothetical protein
MAPVRVVAAQPRSLKRKAIEAKLQVQQSVKRRAIDLGANIPFTYLLKLVEDGFGALS